MASPTIEIINGVLFVTGSLDRSADQQWSQALEQYHKHCGAEERVIDMSNVRWLAPTGAKVLIAMAQEASDKQSKVRILASRHVMQTLNLLGAKSWLTIESCLTPTLKPGGSADAPAETAAPGASAPSAPAAPGAEAPPAETPVAPGAEGSPVPPAEAAPPVVAIPVISQRSATTSHAAPLAGPGEELSRGAGLMRMLYPNRRYSFNLISGQQVVGIVRERVAGPWVLLETHGTRKVINLDNVEHCDIL